MDAVASIGLDFVIDSDMQLSPSFIISMMLAGVKSSEPNAKSSCAFLLKCLISPLKPTNITASGNSSIVLYAVRAHHKFFENLSKFIICITSFYSI